MKNAEVGGEENIEEGLGEGIGKPYPILLELLNRKGINVSKEDFANLIIKTARGEVELSKDELLLKRAFDTPEFQALSNADSVIEEPKLDSCSWDDQTKKRVQAFYFQNLADQREWEIKHGLEKGEKAQKEVVSYQESVHRLLEGTNPLLEDDMRSLLEPVVDRVLAQSPKPS